MVSVNGARIHPIDFKRHSTRDDEISLNRKFFENYHFLMYYSLIYIHI